MTSGLPRPAKLSHYLACLSAEMSWPAARVELEDELRPDLASTADREEGKPPGPATKYSQARNHPEEVAAQVSTVTAPASAAQALEMVRAGLGFLAKADATAMAAEVQAHCLLALEQADAIGTAARASILGAFTAGRGYAADADYSPRAWLIHKTRVTRGAAAGHTAWARPTPAPPPGPQGRP